MKKTLFAFVLILALVVSIAAPAAAASGYGDAGLFAIPELDFSAALYDGLTAPQSTVDMQRLAWLPLQGFAPIVCAHRDTFQIIEELGEDSLCYIETPDGTQTWYAFENRFQALNTGTAIISLDGVDLTLLDDSFLLSYTCAREGHPNVVAVVWKLTEPPSRDTIKKP